MFLFPLTIITIQYNTKKSEKYVLLDNADNVMDNLSIVAYHIHKFIFGL
jgi:hypothetical protein